MANFTAGISFTDGVTNDVTAAKLNALIADAVPTSNLSLNSTTGTIANFTSSTANITLGTIANFTSSTSTFLGTITGSTNVVNIGSGQIYKDSSGNVGIGTASPSSILHISKTGAAFPSLSNPRIRLDEVSSGRFGVIEFDSSTNLNIWGSDAGSGSIRFFNGTGSGTERLRIDSSGNVGIGTTSPSVAWSGDAKALQINGSGTQACGARVSNANGSAELFISGTTSLWGLYSTSNLPFALYTNNTERLRITSGGEVYIAGTTDQGAYNLQVNGTGVWGAGAYVNGSDERLKENIQDITSGLDVVEKLRPVSFQYKEEYTADRSIQSGFIAQDLLVALEGKNYLEGVVSQGPTYYNVAYQNLIPILAKAIQELKAENDSLKSRIAALEAA